MAKATRAAFGETLIELASQGHNIVAVDADLAGSTTTAKFGAAYPDRFYDVGIAEQNMIGLAAGLSLSGACAFTGSFAVFGTGRCYDQIRNTVCYPALNVKICPTHSGVSVGPDGGSHQMLEDISLMRGLPNMRVLVPADYQSAKEAIKLAAQEEGPVYVRLGRASVPELYEEGQIQMSFGSSHKLQDGADLSIFACGLEVSEAIKAAEILKQEGITVDLIDVYSIKPLDRDALLASAKKTNRVLCCEEHSIYGGLGSAVAELLAQEHPCHMAFVGTQDVFGTSGEIEELLEEYQLDAQSIVRAAKKLLGR